MKGIETGRGYKKKYRGRDGDHEMGVEGGR